MKVLVTGATGFIGSQLVERLLERGDEVIALSRSPEKAPKREGLSWERWSAQEAGAWQKHVDGVDAVVHLAGKGIFDSRWSESVKRELRQSRLVSTRLLVEAMGSAERKPGVFVCGSAVGFYGDTRQEVDEGSAPGDDFLAELCVDWEKEAQNAEEKHGVRCVNLRTGIVLGEEGGALEQMALPFKMFVGGPVGSGEQHLAWIHLEDEVGLILFALDDVRVRGPLNAVAPNPVTMNTFAKELGAVLGRPSVFRVPAFAMKLAAGDAAEVLLGGQNARPTRALELGYVFRFSEVGETLRALLG